MSGSQPDVLTPSPRPPYVSLFILARTKLKVKGNIAFSGFSSVINYRVQVFLDKFFLLLVILGVHEL